MSRRRVEILMVKGRWLVGLYLVKLYPANEVYVCLVRETCVTRDEKGCWSSVNLLKVLVSRGKETLMSLRRRKHLDSKQANKKKKQKTHPTLDFY